MNTSKLFKSLHTRIKNNYYFWVFFLISTFVFFLWWAAFFPALMSTDSIGQWIQTMDLNKLSDWHPYLSTLYFYFLKLIYNSPATVSLFQIIWTAALFSYIFNFFIKVGLKKIYIYVLFIFFVTSIPIGLFNISLWKDVPFSLCLIGFLFFLCKAIYEKKSVVLVS